jgi:hypothetical protein
VALLLPFLLQAGPTTDLAKRILDAGLDPEECYLARDVKFAREDVRFYLNDGYIIFGRSVDGTRVSAVFTGDVEAGDAEVLLMPPRRSERLSLAAFAKTPNLNEHFISAVMVFTDNTYEELREALSRSGARKNAERGALLAQQWSEPVRNISASFQIRLVKDLMSRTPRSGGLFAAAISGLTVGNFDVLIDPRMHEQVNVGQLAFRDGHAFFNYWTRFTGRSFRSGTGPRPAPEITLKSYSINATLQENLELEVTTTVRAIPGIGEERVLAFDMSPQMRVLEATIDGVPAEVYQPDSLRSNLLRGDQNATFLLTPGTPLEAGREYEVVIRHKGNVISAAGNGVYSVGARGAWYPNRYGQFSMYDVTFRYPRSLDLVATGRVVEDRTEGQVRIMRRRTDGPVRIAGFNLGEYERHAVNRAGYAIEVYANRRLEKALEPKPRLAEPLPPLSTPNRQWRPNSQSSMPIEPPVPASAASRAERIAADTADGLEFMAARFGPPVLKTLTVSPIPGTFGQGFPGLIYLSTLTYLPREDRPQAAKANDLDLFFSEILNAHEIAHQWWGNLVSTEGEEDDWLTEALANYSALLYLEKKKGRGALDAVLDTYRSHLLAKTDSDRTLESAGPISWGHRLSNSQTPTAWRTITYEKGSWIIHMLRRRLGDERFFNALAQFRKTFGYRVATTDDFRLIMAQALPPDSPDPRLEAFFEQWVQATGIPKLKMDYTVRGKAPAVRVSGSVRQTEADDDFSVWVPVEVQVARGKPIVQWVRTSSEPVSFSVSLRQPPTRVLLDPGGSVLKK